MAVEAGDAVPAGRVVVDVDMPDRGRSSGRGRTGGQAGDERREQAREGKGTTETMHRAVVLLAGRRDVDHVGAP